MWCVYMCAKQIVIEASRVSDDDRVQVRRILGRSCWVFNRISSTDKLLTEGKARTRLE